VKATILHFLRVHTVQACKEGKPETLLLLLSFKTTVHVQETPSYHAKRRRASQRMEEI
jgi:hypothetical protein